MFSFDGKRELVGASPLGCCATAAGERLKLWKYEADLYETYLSEVELSDRRMKKLEQVSVQELQEIREAMYKKRRSAYQESMMEALRK